ncbi:FAD-dependent oxidoreductase [Methanoculleus sp. FWC-SCC1]|uniref:FAD-dependent oxidoreductase n=1 Tax=Methanoculleus frigidifontis TaxID=2584085 RepID=A0ABT8M7C9_9EURY|nr:FAD-dependent oxidoreductase [Methanoculleus sp. FWC-SCC1]MDN7023846.1 FAD-dependent oxidoreductase [Methanoculleus sp. FWC-SCC1]
MDVIILGGGLAGCSTAYYLKQMGNEVTIVEKNRIGGLLNQIHFQNSECYCDLGPHFLFLDKDIDDVRKLFSQYSELIKVEPYACTFPTGNLTEPHDYPISHSNIERWIDKEQIKKEINPTPNSSNFANFKDFVVQQCGMTLYSRYFQNYTKKFWGMDPADVVGDWIGKKIKFPRGATPFFGEDEVFYPKEKYENILSNMIQDCNIIYNEVDKIKTSQGKIVSVATKEKKELKGDIFVSTVEPSILVNDRFHIPEYRSMIIVAILVSIKSDKIFNENVLWGYFPNHYHFTRLTNYAHIAQIHKSDLTLVSFEFPCFFRDGLWGKPDDWFQSYVTLFLANQNVVFELIECSVQRIEKAYPIPSISEIRKFNAIEEYFQDFSNISFIGRIGSYKYTWMRDIVQEAKALSEHLTSR